MFLETELASIKNLIGNELTQKPGEARWAIDIGKYSNTAREAIKDLLQENGFTAEVNHIGGYGQQETDVLSFELPASITTVQIKDRWAQQLLETVLHQRNEALEKIKLVVLHQVRQKPGQTCWAINIGEHDQTARKAITNLLQENGFTAEVELTGGYYTQHYILSLKLPASVTQAQPKGKWVKEFLAKMGGSSIATPIASGSGNGNIATYNSRPSPVHTTPVLSPQVPSSINQENSVVLKAKMQLKELILSALKTGLSEKKQLEIKRKDAVHALAVFTEFLQHEGIQAAISSAYNPKNDSYSLIIDTNKLVACQTNDEFINQLQQAVIDSQKQALSAAVSQRDATINNNNNAPPRPPAASSSGSSLATNVGKSTQSSLMNCNIFNPAPPAVPKLNLQIDEYKKVLNNYLTTQINRLRNENAGSSEKCKALYTAQNVINNPQIDLSEIKKQVKAIKETVKKHEVTDGFVGFFNKVFNPSTKSYDEFMEVLKQYPELASDKSETPIFQHSTLN